jgi:hypothetical protein
MSLIDRALMLEKKEEEGKGIRISGREGSCLHRCNSLILSLSIINITCIHAMAVSRSLALASKSNPGILTLLCLPSEPTTAAFRQGRS